MINLYDTDHSKVEIKAGKYDDGKAVNISFEWRGHLLQRQGWERSALLVSRAQARTLVSEINKSLKAK